jgi:carbon monoxide dehydrogenase subunit G
MRIRGTYLIAAPRSEVFAAICDPNALLAVIPGCRAIEKVSDEEYRGEIVLRLPGFVGSYRTEVRLVDAEEPRGGTLEGKVAGRAGTIKGSASFTLDEADGETRLAYHGAAVISGPLARLDGRFAEGLAQSLLNQGLGRLDARLRREPVAAGSVGRRA